MAKVSTKKKPGEKVTALALHPAEFTPAMAA